MLGSTQLACRIECVGHAAAGASAARSSGRGSSAARPRASPTPRHALQRFGDAEVVSDERSAALVHAQHGRSWALRAHKLVLSLGVTGRLDGAPIELTLPTASVQQGILFTEVRSGRNSVLVVDQIAPGLGLEEAGVQPGDRLVALSDPIRNTEMVTLSESASLRFVRDALRLRRAPTITLVLLRGDASLLQALAAQKAAGGAPQQQQRSVRDVLKEEYASRQGDAASAQTAARRRIAKREAYLKEVEKRNDSGFFLRVAAVVLGVPLAILAVAAQQGWLFRTYTGGY